MKKSSLPYLFLINFFLFSCNFSNENINLKKEAIKSSLNEVSSSKKEKISENILKKKKIINKIEKVKKEKLSSSDNNVIFEFKSERYLEGVVEKEYQKNIEIAKKAVQATLKMLTKAPTTGMEELTLSKNFDIYKPISYEFTNYFDHKESQYIQEKKKSILLFLPYTGIYKEFGKKLRKSLELGLFENKNSNIKYLYFDSGKNFNKDKFIEFIKNNKPLMILGPLLREKLIKIKSIVKNFKIPVFSFTNDINLKEKNIWITGFSPEDQIEKLTNYSINCKKNKMGFIGVDDEYGNMALKSIINKLQGNSLEKFILIKKETIFNKEILNNILKRFLEYRESKDLKLIKTPRFETIFIIGDANFVLEIMPILTYYDLDLSKTDILGTPILNDKLLINEHSLLNAKFPMIEQLNKDIFLNKWKSMWTEKPDDLARLGYDISKIIFWLLNQEKNIEELIRENQNKFSILGNKFILYENGKIFRPSEIFKISSIGKIKKVNDCL